MGGTTSSCCREEKDVPTETIRVQRSEDCPFDEPLPGIADESEVQGDIRAQSAAADEERLPNTFEELPKNHEGLRRLCRGSRQFVWFCAPSTSAARQPESLLGPCCLG